MLRHQFKRNPYNITPPLCVDLRLEDVHYQQNIRHMAKHCEGFISPDKKWDVVLMLDAPMNPTLEAGGKPSPWFLPGELVELSTSKKRARTLWFYGNISFWYVFHKLCCFIFLCSICFWNSVFQILKIFVQRYECFKTRNRYHLMPRTLHFLFDWFWFVRIISIFVFFS